MACGKGECRNGEKDGEKENCGRVRRTSGQERKGSPSAEERRAGWQLSREGAPEKRQMVKELEAEGSCGPLGHVTRGKGRLPDEQERGENVAEADVFRKGNV